MFKGKGIDISKHNGAIEWDKVNVDFAMIRATFGWDNPKQIDSMLETNVKGCEENHIPYGFYHYSYATSKEDAIKEADFFYENIKAYHPTMPVFFDVEEKAYLQLPVSTRWEICKAFCDRLQSRGYFVGIYSMASELNNLRAYTKEIDKYCVWVAHVNVTQPNYSGSFGIWQYSWKGSVDGVPTPVDMNYSYADYPGIIAKSGLNNPKSEAEQSLKAEYDALKAKYDALIENIEKLIKEYE